MNRLFFLLLFSLSMLLASCGANKEYQTGLDDYERSVAVMEENLKLLEKDIHNEKAAADYNKAKDSMEAAAKRINSLVDKKITISAEQSAKADQLNKRVKALNEKMESINKKLMDEDNEKILMEKEIDDEPVLHENIENK